MTTEYIEERNGGYYISGTRVSFDSIVYAFERGNSPESIRESFPGLKLAQIYGAIAFYLDHEAEVRQYLAGEERRIQESSIPLSLGMHSTISNTLGRSGARNGICLEYRSLSVMTFSNTCASFVLFGYIARRSAKAFSLMPVSLSLSNCLHAFAMPFRVGNSKSVQFIAITSAANSAPQFYSQDCDFFAARLFARSRF
jgi:uncharacterized protein (DUF433 family)